MSAFDTFVERLTQLELDQSFYESLVGSELQGVQHEELVKLGKSMCKRLRKFADMGQSFAETLPPDFTAKLTESIEGYRDLMVPPKILGGFCPCLKPARSGPEYDKKILTVKSKMVTSLFVTQAVIVESRGEKINMDSMHYADYCNKMNKCFDQLNDVKCKGSDKALENARKKLLACLEQVEKFVGNFGDDNKEFKAEATRRIRSTQELLNSRQQSTEDNTAMPLSKRVLIKAQSSLQEIMNSAAAIALAQAKENLNTLDTLQTALKKARDIEVTTFNSMEEPMHEAGLMEVLHRLREDSEVSHSDAASKLRDAIKRWTSIKGQSNPRKVAEYEEEDSSQVRNVTNVLPGEPAKALKKAKQDIGNAGKEVVSSVTGTANLVKNDLKNLVSSGANLATTGVQNIKNVGTKAAEGTKKALGLEEAPPPPPPKKQGLAKFVPDAVTDMTGIGAPTPPPKKGKSKTGSNLFDF